MTALTPLQGRALDAIRSLRQGGVAPSLRKIQAALGLRSISQAHRLIGELEARGAVVRQRADERSRACSIEIPGDVDLLSKPTKELRWMRDQIDRELRRRAW